MAKLISSARIRASTGVTWVEAVPVELRSEAESEFRFVAPEQMASGLANWLIATAHSETISPAGHEAEKPVSLQTIGHENNVPLTIGTLTLQVSTKGRVTLSGGKVGTRDATVSEFTRLFVEIFLAEAIITATSTSTLTTETREDSR